MEEGGGLRRIRGLPLDQEVVDFAYLVYASTCEKKKDFICMDSAVANKNGCCNENKTLISRFETCFGCNF